MAGRYASALEQVRAILASRSQAEPILQAKHLSDEFACWPIPSLRTIRRMMEQVRLEAAGRRGQEIGRAA